MIEVAQKKCAEKYLQSYDSKSQDDKNSSASIFETEEKNKKPEEKLKDEDIKYLEDCFKEGKDEQGFLGNLLDGAKSFLHLGKNSNKCEKAIQDYKEGKTDFENAQKTVTDFQNSREESVNMTSNILAGVAASAVLGSAVLTGGLSLGVLAAAAGIGAGVKAGIKFIDRATNKVEGDAADVKKIAKDGATGAIDGMVAVGTMGMGAGIQQAAGQGMKEVVKQGVLSGAKTGATSGGIMGASNYAIDAAFEKDIDFNPLKLVETTFKTAAGGAIVGGILGGVGSTIKFNKAGAAAQETQGSTEVAEEISEGTDDVIKNIADDAENTVDDVADDLTDDVNKNTTDETAKTVPATQDIIDEKEFLRRKEQFPELSDEEILELSEQAKKLKDGYTELDQYKKEIDELTKGNKSVAEITARTKGEGSIFSKLANKFKKGKLTEVTDSNCYEAIGDAYGGRIQLRSLDCKETRSFIEKYLESSEYTYDDVVEFLQNGKIGSNAQGCEELQEISKDILSSLKEKQTQEIVDSLVAAIKNKSGEGAKLNITELSNYGDDISSYFTGKQLDEIADAYFEATGEKLTIVTKMDDSFFSENFGKFTKTGENTYEAGNAIFETKGAIKGSGYASTHMNTLSEGQNGILKGELQIRGTKLNTLADAEHIPYDIRSGKIVESDTKYSEVFKLIKNMNDETYEAYNEYLTKTYNWNRLNELGIETQKPEMSEELISALGDKKDLLTDEGLIALHNKK